VYAALYKLVYNKFIQKNSSLDLWVCKRKKGFLLHSEYLENSNVILWCQPIRLPASPVDGISRRPRRPSPWRDQKCLMPSPNSRASRGQPVNHGQPFEHQVSCKIRIWNRATWWMWHTPGHRPGLGGFRKEDRGTVHSVNYLFFLEGGVCNCMLIFIQWKNCIKIDFIWKIFQL